MSRTLFLILLLLRLDTTMLDVGSFTLGCFVLVLFFLLDFLLDLGSTGSALACGTGLRDLGGGSGLLGCGWPTLVGDSKFALDLAKADLERCECLGLGERG